MVSIILRTHNRAALLPRAIDSILRQSSDDWELVIVDDGSTDETGEILARYDDPRIRVVRHPENRGPTAALNTGLDNLGGEWFTTMDDDDEILPEAVEVLLATARQTGAAAITCNCADSQTGDMTGRGWESSGWKQPSDWASISGDHWGITKTSLLDGLRFDERLPGYEGTVWAKVTMRAGRRYYLHRVLRINHTEPRSDRVTVRARSMSLASRLQLDLIVAEDNEYLAALKVMDRARHRELRRRIAVAKTLEASRLLKLPVFRSMRPRSFKLLTLALAAGLFITACLAALRRSR